MGSGARELKQGEFLCKVGDPVSNLYIVKNGTLILFVEKDGHLVPLKVAEEEAFIGEECLLGDKTYAFYCIALKDSSLVEIAFQDIETFMTKTPGHFRQMMAEISQRIRSEHQVIIEHRIVSQELHAGLEWDRVEAKLKRLLKES